MADPTARTGRLSRLRDTLREKQLSRPDETVEAVVGVLLHEDPSSCVSILLIHRAERVNDPWSGQIGLPGGRVVESDSSTRDALRREVAEEVGIDLSEVGEELGTMSIGSPMRQLGMKVQPWVYRLPNVPEVRVGPEVQQAFWVAVAMLPSLRSFSEIQIRGTCRVVDSFIVDGHVVWGYTHRVLDELLSLQEKPS